MQEWIDMELETSDLGDKRLDERYRVLADQLSRKPSASIPTACGGWKETVAAYRFFDNERVCEGEVLQPHQEATVNRIQEQPVALLVQDTTEIDVTRPEQQVEGAGPLNDESRRGFFDHVLLAVTPERIPLGVVDAEIWARDMDEFLENQKDDRAKRKKRRYKPIEEKESLRWLEGYRRGCEIADQAPDTRVVVISDSEGDIFECFAEAEGRGDGKKAEWIVRACQDRIVRREEREGWAKLWDEVGSTPVLGTMEIEVSTNRPKSKDDRKRKQSRSARKTALSIQATRVKLKGPWRPAARLADVAVNAVLVREINPPPDEEPIEWLLLTSLPINTFKRVCLVIDYYCCRWQIEIYFRVLKSGCRVEERQLETVGRLKPCLALYMIVAWRVMYVLMLGRQCPEMPCNLVFSDDEWKAVYTVVRHELPPQTPPPLEEMVYIIASLGGYLGRANDGPPGPKTMWTGMQRMMDLALGWRAFGPAAAAFSSGEICV